MKKLVTFFLLALSFSSPCLADTLDFNNSDHQLHLSAGFAINLTTYSILREKTELSKLDAMLISTGGTLLLGVLKESLSSQFSGAQLEAVGVGAVTSLVIPVVFNF